jgi:hypothetical protein
MPAHTAPRVAGKLASYGCASLAELDAHVAALYVRARTAVLADKRAIWGDIDKLLDARHAMTVAVSSPDND